MKKRISTQHKMMISTLILLMFALSNVFSQETSGTIEDEGKKPWIIDIEKATMENKDYRKAVWTGEYMQLVLMSLEPGEEIKLELHSGNDQFIRIESGVARVLMGKEKDNLSFDKTIGDDWIMMIPAGYWHNIINVGQETLKVYTLYGLPVHEAGTVHETHEEAEDHHH
ncbi:MAG: cupin domain-containing protein [Bacteroidota bacterium]